MISNGVRYSIFQNLGPSATACHLDPAGVVMACESVIREIARGCDLVILSKFGKLEAEGGGFNDAFAAALDANIPILTSVAPSFQKEWNAFAAPYFEMLPPNAELLGTWWNAVHATKLELAS